MHCLVTGAAGFIGSHTVLELLQAGHTVYAVDNFANSIADSNGLPVSLQRVAKLAGVATIPFEKVDMLDKEALARVFSQHKFDAVIHLAALKAVGESSQRPIDYYANNVSGSLNLVAAARKAGVNGFVFSSSATVYGEPEKLPLTESTRVGQGISNPYGQTKYMVEVILKDVAQSDPAFRVIILRYFNPVGAHESGVIGEDPKGVPNNLMPYVSQVAVGRLPKLTIYGDKWKTKDGTGVRDYIHIVDLAKGHVAALSALNRQGYQVYNLGTGTGYSVREMVAALEKASGRQVPTVVGEPRPGDLAEVYCDPSLANKELGWKAERGLDEMCRDLWKWQSQNPNGFAEQQ